MASEGKVMRRDVQTWLCSSQESIVGTAYSITSWIDVGWKRSDCTPQLRVGSSSRCGEPNPASRDGSISLHTHAPGKVDSRETLEHASSKIYRRHRAPRSIYPTPNSGLLVSAVNMTKPFSRVRAAAIDGRLSNVYKRQTELERLHRTLVQNSQTIKDAIIEDTGYSAAEAAIEYHLTLASLKKQYTLLDPRKELEDEYRIARGEDAPDRREASGIVYIVPTSHTLLFSVIAPLSAAIAAGNCVVVQV